MAFPSTPVLDDFNRANGGPGANWTVLFSGDGVGTIDTNQMKGTAVASDNAYWNALTPLESEVYMDVPTFDTGGAFLYVAARMVGSNGYLLRVISTGDLQLFRMVASASTQLGTNIAVGFASGDSFGMEVAGSGAAVSVAVYWKRTSWALQTTYSDTHADRRIGAGRIAYWHSGTAQTFRWDNFGGGGIASPIRSQYLDFDYSR